MLFRSVFDKKTLIYFPTVALINRFYDYCIMQELGRYVVRYHGQMHKTEKIESYEAYLAGQKKIMLATKAFGMGIDIDDIEVIIHFAPTGNVCDYVQEIGRAARRKDLQGQALYKYMSNDFKHINRLHGLSTIQKFQLVQVIEKVYELYTQKIRNVSSNRLTRRQNSMLIDAESFSYIFEGPMGDQDDAINKVKSAMLMIQKDFESRFGFAPFYVRPIPLFSQGYFQISEHDQRKLHNKYPNILTLSDEANNICMVDLSRIWEKDYKKLHSFPQFKYLLYTKDPELKFNLEYPIEAALCVSFTLNDHYADNFSLLFESFKLLIINCVREIGRAHV